MKQNSTWRLKKMKNRRDPFDAIVDIFLIACFILVICLKATGIITLSWFWLFFPIICLFGIGVVLALILGIICIVVLLISNKEIKDERY